MPATGKAADDGRVIDLAEATKERLAAKADKGSVVTGIETSDGSALPVVDGVVTLPAPAPDTASTDYAAIVTIVTN